MGSAYPLAQLVAAVALFLAGVAVGEWDGRRRRIGRREVELQEAQRLAFAQARALRVATTETLARLRSLRR